MLPAGNLTRARDRQPTKKTKDLPRFKIRGLLLLKNHKKHNWDAKYMPNFHICKVISDRANDLQDPTDHVRCTAAANIQLVMSVEYIACYQT